MKYRHSKTRLYIMCGLWALLIPVFGVGLLAIAYLVLVYKREYITITDDAVLLNTGLLTTNELEIPFKRINNVSIRKGPLSSILGYGNIVIFTGNDVAGISFKDVDNPAEVKKQITQRMHSRES